MIGDRSRVAAILRMSLKAKVEAIIYATEEPVTLDQLASLLGDATLTKIRLRMQNRTPQGIYRQTGLMASPRSSRVSRSPPGDLSKGQKQAVEKRQLHAIKSRLTTIVDQLIADYATADRGMEIREVAGGYRIATKPEYHDAVRAFVKASSRP